jgi:hypothetical protein
MIGLFSCRERERCVHQYQATALHKDDKSPRAIFHHHLAPVFFALEKLLESIIFFPAGACGALGAAVRLPKIDKPRAT